MSNYKPRICVDFDGVLNDYTGWKGEHDLGNLAPGASDFLFRLQQQGYEVVILTTRPASLVSAWFDEREIGGLVDEVTNVKPPAFAYVDDRAICHRGDFLDTFAELNGFKAHWETA